MNGKNPISSISAMMQKPNFIFCPLPYARVPAGIHVASRVRPRLSGLLMMAASPHGESPDLFVMVKDVFAMIGIIQRLPWA